MYLLHLYSTVLQLSCKSPFSDLGVNKSMMSFTFEMFNGFHTAIIFLHVARVS